MNFSAGEYLAIPLLQEYYLKSHIKGYHAHINKWNPTMDKPDKLLKTRLKLENEYDKFAVVVEKCGFFSIAKRWKLSLR